MSAGHLLRCLLGHVQVSDVKSMRLVCTSWCHLIYPNWKVLRPRSVQVFLGEKPLPTDRTRLGPIRLAHTAAWSQVTEMLPLFHGVNVLDLTLLGALNTEQLHPFTKPQSLEGLKLRGGDTDTCTHLLGSFPSLTAVELEEVRGGSFDGLSRLRGLRQLSWSWGSEMRGLILRLERRRLISGAHRGSLNRGP